ncbi:MAG: GNAT family N-acetyltransferase [Deltaproteobacteria bacterium]|nr:GNAT family N-acetyltransferase [Deltaproteobacteria bacterium]
MELISKGQKTDIVMDSLETSIENTPDYIVVRTPSMPDYYSGNKVIFPQPAQSEQEFAKWMDLYRQKFDVPKQGFMHFTWDQNPAETDWTIYTKQGFTIFTGHTLSLQQIEKPARLNQQVRVRTIHWKQDFHSWKALHVDPHGSASIEYQQRYWQMKGLKLQQFQEIFPGQRWVIEQDGELVADLGLYAIKDIARFHAPMVAPKWRKKGYATRLIYEAAVFAKQYWQVREMILVSEVGSDADRLYAQLGFIKIEDIGEATKVLPKEIQPSE